MWQKKMTWNFVVPKKKEEFLQKTENQIEIEMSHCLSNQWLMRELSKVC